MEKSVLRDEETLIYLATFHHLEAVANEAMRELRTFFDATYIWCEDCDGLVCKTKDCCLNHINNVSNSMDI